MNTGTFMLVSLQTSLGHLRLPQLLQLLTSVSSSVPLKLRCRCQHPAGAEQGRTGQGNGDAEAAGVSLKAEMNGGKCTRHAIFICALF